MLFQSERSAPEECAAERADLSQQAVTFVNMGIGFSQPTTRNSIVS